MSSNSTISISFKIADGADGLKTLTLDAEGLAKTLRSDKTIEAYSMIFKNMRTAESFVKI